MRDDLSKGRGTRPDASRESSPMVLLVEDDSDIREQMKWGLTSRYVVHEATDRRTALASFRRELPRLVLLDLGLPPDTGAATEGLATLHEILRLEPSAKVIIVTGNSDRANALAAIEAGACDFIEKPVNLELLRVVLQRAAHVAALEQENQRLRKRSLDGEFEGILGVSPAMQKVFEVIRRVSDTNVPVLITGESGTGKELIAGAIHSRSSRRNGPFVAINCGAIPETLLESELFGHEKGAYTGADRQRPGKLELASGGTLFLDEVGEMSLGLQVKLLRFLQDGKVERLGGRTSIAVETRVLAATNEDLKAAIAEGRFREDLFYRLGVVELPVPPLRERGDDVLLLTRAFMGAYREEVRARATELSPEAKDAIRAHPWPGNVRELQNRIKRAVLMAAGSLIQPADFELPSIRTEKPTRNLREAKAQLERDLIQQALVLHGGNISRAAEGLGISRQALHDCINKYGLDKPR